MINLIAAVGNEGQIGYEGQVPWFKDAKIANVVKSDLGWFSKLTQGGVLIVGSATYREMLTMGFRHGKRDVAVWNGTYPAKVFLEEIETQHPDKEIWVCGGAHTYATFMRFVQRHHISRIPWSGKADRFMPPILPVWGYTGGPIRG